MSYIKDYLKDLTNHIAPLGSGTFENLRVDGRDQNNIKFQTTGKDRQIVIFAKTKAPISEIDDLFGIPNITQLKAILDLSEYQEDVEVLINKKKTSDGSEIPYEVHFATSSKDVENNFRLQSKQVIESKESESNLKVKNWPVEFLPESNNIKRLQEQAAVHSEEIAVELIADGGKIVGTIGDSNNHNAKFVFHSSIKDDGKRYRVIAPIAALLGVLRIAGEKTVYIGDLGIRVVIDSGLIEYDYIIPSLSK